MLQKVCLGFVLGLAVAGSIGSKTAHAQIGGPGGYGLGFFNYAQGLNTERIPYYALFPPVYYSYPVARTYGYSPFAYPPGVMTPEVAPQSAAVEFRNPFVPRPAAASADKTASAPQMHYNPFVKQSRTAGMPATVRQAP